MHILKYTLFKKKYSDYNCIKLCLGYVCLSSYVCGGKEGKEAREEGGGSERSTGMEQENSYLSSHHFVTAFPPPMFYINTFTTLIHKTRFILVSASEHEAKWQAAHECCGEVHPHSRLGFSFVQNHGRITV